MGRKFDFDYIIIGSGPAGTTAALELAKNKRKKIAIVESKNYGGSNLNTRDIPYAVSLNFVHNFYNLKKFPEIAGQDFHYNFPTIASHQDSVITSLGFGDKTLYRNAGITCIDGFAYFIDSNTIAVGDDEFSAHYFIIATGAKLNTAGIIGFDSTVNYLTPDTIIKIRRLPKYTLVVGAGSTGCEIAEYLAKLGSKVILMESASRILPKEDPEASESLRDYFEKELGIIVMENCQVVEIASDGNVKRVIFSTDGREKMVRIDCVVLATGSKPCVSCGLENAGVKFNKAGIVVDKFFQTSIHNIYAIGDCIGNNSSTERAQYEATLLVNNLLHKSKTPASQVGFPRITATDPEIAVVGKTEADLIRAHTKYQKSIVYLKDLPASEIYQNDYGLVKVLFSPNGRIIGATIMAPNASLMITEFSIALKNHLSIQDLADTPHIANSFNYAIYLALKPKSA